MVCVCGFYRGCLSSIGTAPPFCSTHTHRVSVFSHPRTHPNLKLLGFSVLLPPNPLSRGGFEFCLKVDIRFGLRPRRQNRRFAILRVVNIIRLTTWLILLTWFNLRDNHMANGRTHQVCPMDNIGSVTKVSLSAWSAVPTFRFPAHSQHYTMGHIYTYIYIWLYMAIYC